jgi:histidinol-phosphate aminotransferase
MSSPARVARSLPQPRADLGLREGYHSAQVAAPVRLNTNESPYPPPSEWVEALVAEARGMAFNRYPDRNYRALRQALARLHGVQPEQVFAANGSNEVLQSIGLAYGGPGRRAAMFEPTYALHAHIAHLTGTGVVQGQRGPDFTLDVPAALDLLEKEQPSIVFVCSPNNPTGLAESASTVSSVLGGAPGLVVVDEAYGQFASWSALALVDEDTPLVVVRTYSKTWSMAGLRLGYLVGPSEVVRVLERVALPYHLDLLKQAAGRLALEYSGQMEQRTAAIVAERERMTTGLSALGLKVWPSQANFVLWRAQGRDGAHLWQALVDRGVLVRDMSTWPRLEGCLRTTIGTPEENDAFLSALVEVLV